MQPRDGPRTPNQIASGGEASPEPDRQPGADPGDPAASNPIQALEALLRLREAEYTRELAERERRAAEWERAYKQAVRERELAAALAGRPLVAGAASQLLKLWSGEFDVYEEGGATRVATRDGRSVARAVADWLASPEYAHFCPSTSRGGTTAPGSNRLGAPGLPSAPAPKTLGDAAIQRWREAASTRPSEASSPIGLHRRR